MELNSLKVKDFLGLKSNEIDLSQCKVAFLQGLNNSGKTSFRNALSFAFTGKCRGMTKFNQAKYYARNGSEKMSVELEYKIDDMVCTIQRGLKNPGENVQETSEFLPYCLDPMSFLRLKPKERGKIIASAVTSRADAIKAAVSRHIPKFPNYILKKVKTRGIDPHDLDEVEKVCAEARRDYKRDLKRYEETSEPDLEDFGLDEEYDNKEALKRIEELTQFIETVVKAKDSKERIESELKEAQDKWNDLINQLDENTLTDKEMEALKCGSGVVITAIEDAIGNNKAGEKLLCPICQTPTSTEGLKKRAAKLKSQQRGFAEAQAKMSAKSQLEERARSTNSRIKELKQQLDGITIPEGNVTSMQTEQQALADNTAKYREYTEAKEKAKEDAEAAEATRKLVEECDEMAKKLGEGGVIRQELNEIGDPLPIDRELCKSWDVGDLEWLDDGEITLHGRMIELASYSEQYRVASVMGMALASISDVGFTILDGFECLVGSNQSMDILDRMIDSGLQVLVLTSITKPIKSDDLPDKVEAFKVADGKVTKS